MSKDKLKLFVIFVPNLIDLTLLIASSVQAAVFEDDEARRAILDLRQRVENLRQAQQSSEAAVPAEQRQGAAEFRLLEPLVVGLKSRGFCFATLREHPDYRDWVSGHPLRVQALQTGR